MSKSSALEPEKRWLPFPQPKDPKNGSLTSLNIVISHQMLQVALSKSVWCYFFLDVNVPSISLGTWKKVASLPSAQGPNKWKFDIPQHCDKSPKCCKWRCLKVCDAIVFRCECPKHQPWNLKKDGFPSLSPRTQKMEAWHPSALW